MAHKAEVDVFFYGGYMDFKVLESFGIGERDYHVAQLMGYELIIGRSANVRKKGLQSVFGIITRLTHDEIDVLYGQEAQAKLGTQYFPEPTLIMTSEGNIVPAFCYIAYESVAGDPSNQYIDTILNASKDYDFPKHYIQHIASFKTT
jgi:hypothetical protein